MNGIPPAFAAKMAMTQQNATMSMVKNAAQTDQQVANMIAETVESAPKPSPTSSGRGSTVNILV